MKVDFNGRPLKVFCSYYRGHRGLFAIDMLCSVIVAAIDLVFPFVSREAMQRFLPDKLFRTFFIVMAVMVLAYILKAALYYVITVVGHRMGVLIEADMRRDCFTHMQSLSYSFYDRNRTGSLLSRITNDLFEITELAHHGPENLLISVLTLVGALAILFTVEWRLALVLTVVLPLCGWFTMTQRVRMREANLDVKRRTAQINAAIENGISGIRTAKAFANEQVEEEKFDASNAMYKSAKVEYYRSMGLFNSGMEFTMGIMQVAVIAAGGLFIIRGHMDYIALITFTLYVSTFVSPIRKLAQFAEVFMQGTAGFSRFLEIMRTAPDVADSPEAAELEGVRGEVEYKNVGFSYKQGQPVLEDISFTLRPGESLAVVGPSGGGKTTLCHLLPRFYDVTAGAVLVDGVDVRAVTQSSLRRNIGVIQQDVFLFAGTIRDNIRYGRPDATDEEIVEAAVRAQLHREILAMPDGYDTNVGERGVLLSGGQKQRLSIARVILKNPPILIMDEATSALDTVTEQRIQESLDALGRGRTSIVIAHRLSTVKNAGRIAVIDNARIAETGTHEELMSRDGEYAALCRAQELK